MDGSTIGKESRKKSYFLVARPLRGGGVRAWPLRKKIFFEAREKKNVATNLEGGGVRPSWPGHYKNNIIFLRLPYAHE